MWADLPWLGVGQRWDGPQDARRLRYFGDGLSYFEPALPMRREQRPRGVPLLAHSSELALATSGALNPAMLRRLAADVRELASPWAGEHFCLNSTIDTGDLGYNFAPLLDEPTIAATAANVRAVQRAYGCPLAIEAGPRYFAWDGRSDDHACMAEVAVRTDCAIIVDISHHLCTALNLGLAPEAGLSPAALERTVELHVTGIGAHRTRGFFHDSHDVAVPEEAWRLLAWALERTPNLRAVTLEHSAAVPDDVYERDLRRLQALVGQRGPV